MLLSIPCFKLQKRLRSFSYCPSSLLPLILICQARNLVRGKKTPKQATYLRGCDPFLSWVVIGILVFTDNLNRNLSHFIAVTSTLSAFLMKGSVEIPLPIPLPTFLFVFQNQQSSSSTRMHYAFGSLGIGRVSVEGWGRPLFYKVLLLKAICLSSNPFLWDKKWSHSALWLL